MPLVANALVCIITGKAPPRWGRSQKTCLYARPTVVVHVAFGPWRSEMMQSSLYNLFKSFWLIAGSFSLELRVNVKTIMHCDMKRLLLFSLAVLAMLTANAGNSPYIAHVYDYLPAPGQFVNTLTSGYKPGFTRDSVMAYLEEELCGNTSGTISLGSYGGYIVFGFDHPVINKHDYDVKIYGNAFQSASVSNQAGGSSEPGIIMVGVDLDGDGVPSDADRWYEIKGSEYDRCQLGFEVTFYKPDENKVKVPHESWRFITDTEYVYWTSNNPEATEGYVWRNTFHSQPYWPLWIEDTVLTFRGTRLPNTAVDLSDGNGNNWFQPFLDYGYVDASLNAQNPGFKIDWAIDEEGEPVELDHIDFIKVYNAQLDYCGIVGEVSTEICGAEDLHPDADGGGPGPGLDPEDFTFTNGIIFVNEDRYGPNQGSLNYYNYDYDEMEYNVYAIMNPDTKLGVTTQFGQLFGDRLFLVSKQANSTEASGSTFGSRLAVLDAATLKQQGCLLRFGESPDSIYDGRAYCAVTPDKGYVSTSGGIFVIDVPTMSVSGHIEGTLSSAKSDNNSLYEDQCGDMVRFGQYVFAVQQGKGLHVIDPQADAIVKTLPFPDIVTVFVTAGGNLYVANNSREIYDYSGGPYEADFTRIDPVTLEVAEVYPLGERFGAVNSWGAWRACMVCVDPVAERVYYNYDEYQDYISSYDFTAHAFTDTLITLPDGVEINWDGTIERQGLYASALSFDPHKGYLVVQTTEAAPGSSYQNFNHNWVLFYDVNSRQLLQQIRLQNAYWFPAMAVYPDVCAPTVIIADTQLAQGENYTIDLIGAVSDDDNMAALAVATAQSDNPSIARIWVSGIDLHIEAIAPGSTTVNVSVDSNGRLATTTFSIIVTPAITGDVDNSGQVNISDVTALIDYLLSGDGTGVNLVAADVDCDGNISIADVTALIDILLSGN